MMRTIKFTILFLLLLIGCGCQSRALDQNFSGEAAYHHVQAQLEFGARIPGSSASQETAQYIRTTLEQNSWQVETQDLSFLDVPLSNIIGKKGNGEKIILIGAHYDTRAVADQDSDINLQSAAVPGANDGASGSAVLLELSGVLDPPPGTQVWLVFFVGEDQGHLNDWGWSVGADYFVHQLTEKPAKAVIIDMIGDEDLNIYQEKNSTPALVDELWNIATDLGYQSYLIPEYKYAMIDDHLAFVNQGIDTALLIDFDYPYWHTTHDTIEHVSPASLQIIGDVLVKWIMSQK